MGETGWILLVGAVVLAAVVGPVAALRYLAVRERRRRGDRQQRD